MRLDGKMKSVNGRFSKNFREMVEKVKELEKSRGHEDCSDTIATEIIYKRILNAGGLKENKL